MDPRSFSQKLNSRKLMLTVGVILTATALLVWDYITGDNWVNVTTVMSSAFMVTQVWLDRSKNDG